MRRIFRKSSTPNNLTSGRARRTLQGNIFLGTGSDGKIFKVGANGKGSLFADLNELNVAALAIGKSGELYAGTSPDGKVYRIEANGTANVFFDPKEKYIWSLAVFADGSLAVGTGENGKIYKVKIGKRRAGKFAVFRYERNSYYFACRRQIGKSLRGNGFERISFAVFSRRKTVRFARFASARNSRFENRHGRFGLRARFERNDCVGKTADSDCNDRRRKPRLQQMRKRRKTPAQPKSRYDLSAAKSAVYRILPDGGNDVIWNSADVAAFSIYAHQTGNGVLVGTSDKGRIYSVTNHGQRNFSFTNR